MEAKTSPVDEQKKLLILAILFDIVLLLIMGSLTYVVWGKPDYIIMYVPVPILQWSFAGGMIAVLYRLAYQRNTPGIRLYIWAVAKPIIGLFMGALVYFIALGGGLLLSAQLKDQQLQNIHWLNALAFIGGFSDQFSIGLISRLVSTSSGEQRDNTAIEHEKSSDGR